MRDRSQTSKLPSLSDFFSPERRRSGVPEEPPTRNVHGHPGYGANSHQGRDGRLEGGAALDPDTDPVGVFYAEPHGPTLPATASSSGPGATSTTTIDKPRSTGG